ncbi:hypothetical protein AB0873_19415 [Micromonospora sp. NPDC047707]|uniref:hypothetical protein n=1 Tax=unclassified Micromonospora TaxID=2617518 RepID=UPI0012B4D31F|nr:hypothetical protein [Micromonospora sp. WMMC415]QGN49052.1 hypothetical protein GKC29_20965 [Micromonospora sp. WMMC415]
MISTLVTVVTALAAVAGVAVLVGTGSGRAALRVLLDLLTAAGLLRLVAGQGWVDLATAAAIIALRRLLWAVLTASGRLSAPRPGKDDHGPPLTVGGERGRSGRLTP